MKNNQGFTLIEMMISVAIFGIVMAGIYQTYDSQQKTYIVQEQVIDMQQNHRTAIYFLGQDLRMAGYDPSGKADVATSSGSYQDPPGFTIIDPSDTPAEINEFQITMDLNGDRDIDSSEGEPDPNEIIRYALTNDAGTCDADGDGISDSIDANWVNSGAECNLGRENITLNGSVTSSNGLQPVANNIDAVEFLYILEDGSVTKSVGVAELEDIRGVIVSILARTKNQIKGYLNTHEYLPASNAIDDTVWGRFNDRYRRNLYITRFKCRNMGRNPYEAMK
jgi:type IV pilus assembly protein PilW